jgi:hypothetical protein
LASLPDGIHTAQPRPTVVWMQSDLACIGPRAGAPPRGRPHRPPVESRREDIESIGRFTHFSNHSAETPRKQILERYGSLCDSLQYRGSGRAEQLGRGRTREWTGPMLLRFARQGEAASAPSDPHAQYASHAPGGNRRLALRPHCGVADRRGGCRRPMHGEPLICLATLALASLWAPVAASNSEPPSPFASTYRRLS